MNRSYANELKRTEKECRQTEERLIGAQRLMLVVYWEWNLETKKYGWCDEMYRIFNLTAATISPEDWHFFQLCSPRR